MGKYNKIIHKVNEFKLFINIPKVVREISSVLREEALWKNMPRKSYLQRLKENVLWFLKYKEPCIYYNSYGFDVVGYRDQDSYLPYRQFRIERNLEDDPANVYESKLCILRDKIVFAAFFADAVGDKFIVKTKARIDADGRIYDYISKEYCDIEEYFSKVECELFVKKLHGECGDGCYLFNKNSDIITFKNVAKGSCYIVQDKLQQHEDIDKINASCINTIRIITIVGKESREPQVFAHYMRVGCNSINDNRATGGVGVAITDDGYMEKYGVGHHKVEEKHSITGHTYIDTLIPYWDEVKKLVLNAHRAILEVPTIGWDVAITPSGPVLIEGNDNWEISGAQDTAGGLKQRWYELHER